MWRRHGGAICDSGLWILCKPSDPLTSHIIPPPQTQRLSRSKTFATKFGQCVKYRICSMHEYAICFQIWQTNRQKPNEHSGAFMTVQPQWDHLSIHQLLTNSCCSVALYFRLRFRQSSTWACRGISRQLGWKVRKVVKFYIWHGNSLLIHTEERQNYFPRKTCFIVQMLLFYISKFEAWRLKYEPNTKMTERQNLQPSLVAHKQVLAKHRGAAMCCEKMW